jgi:predicted aldo/keto reductase-like oxidoreductase
MKKSLKRRSFLQLGAATGLASGLSIPAIAESSRATSNPREKGVKRYVTLGRTGMEISDISFGSSRIRQGQEHLVEHAFDQGVNYFDTAENYSGGYSETVIGNALKGKRDKVHLATKVQLGSRTSSSTMMHSLEESLRKLQTDYVDVFFNHAVNDVSVIKNPEWHIFMETAKQQGKVRFSGMSGHGGYLADCVNYAADEDLFDVMLLAHNFGEDPSFYEKLTRSLDMVANQHNLPAAMVRAKEKNVGIVAMKVLRGAKLNDMRPFESNGATYAQAAFRWALNTPTVDAVIISMTSRDDIDEYLGASGSLAVTTEDMRLLKQYAQMTDMTYCRHACNDCEGSCPFGVQIADVLRTRMYATDYGDFSFAKEEYKMLDTDAAACLSCDGAPCRDACTHEIPIASLCGPTHQLLS